MSTGRFEDRVAVVTGGAGGIGAAVVARLLREGARVVVVDLSREAAAAVAGAAPPERAIAVEADVATEEGTGAYVQAALDAFGRIDCFHNNAGIVGPNAPLPDSDPAAFDAVMRTNVRGVYLGLRAVLGHMRARGTGAIVNTASVAGMRAHPGLSPYVASKHAVIGLTRCAAVEAAVYGVRVNAACPGPVDTGMMAKIERMVSPQDPGAARARLAGRAPMDRYATTGEVAALVCWLLSDDAAFVTAGAYPIDGGRLSA